MITTGFQKWGGQTNHVVCLWFWRASIQFWHKILRMQDGNCLPESFQGWIGGHQAPQNCPESSPSYQFNHCLQTRKAMAAILGRRAEGARDTQQLALTASVLQVTFLRRTKRQDKKQICSKLELTASVLQTKFLQFLITTKCMKSSFSRFSTSAWTFD